jgi:hypothetical protein
MMARRLACALSLIVAAAFAGAPAAYAADTACNGTLSGDIAGNVVVPKGASCTLFDATITGNLKISQNASLTVDATQQPATIDGNLEANQCAFALLKGGVTVGGNVQIQKCTQRSGFYGSGVKIHGNFNCTGNSRGCEADLGAVDGDVLIQSNGPSDISLISVGGSLICQSNAPTPAHAFGPDFVKGSLSGQCAATLGFAPAGAAPPCVAATLNVPNLTVTSAGVVAATATAPQYCQIIGAVATNGEGYGPGSALFRLQLPVQWNGHFLFVGCGGNCGSITATSLNPVDGAEALGLGYAVVNTDTGHEQDPTTTLLTWAVSEAGVVNMSAIIDFYYRAIHQVTVATKQYVESYYSQPIDVAYFDGCSTGGRQSLMEGTHYPIDYDGLIVGDPLMAFDYGRASTYILAKFRPVPISRPRHWRRSTLR